MTFSLGKIVLFLAMGLDSVSCTKSIISKIPSQSKRYHLMSFVPLKSLITSFLSPLHLGQHQGTAAAVATFTVDILSEKTSEVLLHFGTNPNHGACL